MGEEKKVSVFHRVRCDCNACGAKWEADREHRSVQEKSCPFCHNWDRHDSKEEFVLRHDIFVLQWPTRR